MALTDKLTAIGNAIRSKTGETELLTLDAMPAAIQCIETGGEIPTEALTLTGDISYAFYGSYWQWFLEKFGSRIKTENITGAQLAFSSNPIKSIDFDLNFEGSQEWLSGTFANSGIEEFNGAIRNAMPSTMENIFSGCVILRYLPEFIDCDFSYIRRNNPDYGFMGMFDSCNSLRYISPLLLDELYAEGSERPRFDGCYLFSSFNNLWALNELVGLNPTGSHSESDMFGGFCTLACRVKDVTFKNGISVNWSNQAIMLDNCVGWSDLDDFILGYNSGLTSDTEITDDESYQRLKNNADSWTKLKEYSRYNRASAIRTIESLPDTSEYGSNNVIQFRGDAGSKTDAGAINTMTEEEIAVATAKGFTISYA